MVLLAFHVRNSGMAHDLFFQGSVEQPTSDCRDWTSLRRGALSLKDSV